ncbi:sensor histidine kinase [Streptomyces sp. NBC_01477]|uniref:sensor histidine kinase n=1 Tax=Streptomyces sp. NBC_01477 TaxID=2976015 RepID=UPI002E359F8D|nr:sensor histidine kinase [Streptomyces sp. NBC_01477]
MKAGHDDNPDVRFQQLQHYLPYIGLTVSLVLALALGPRTAAFAAVACGLSAVAALWLHFVDLPYPAPARQRGRAILFFAGLLVLIAALITLSPFFGFFGFTGYLQVALLPRALWGPAIALNAALMATTQVGGVGNLHGGTLGVYAGLVVVNMVFAGVITFQGIEEDQRSRRRAEMIDELAEANRRLRETMQENAGLHAQLVTQAREAGVLDERQRMAGEIHDTIAQGLTGIVTQLEAAERFDADPARRARHRELARTLARESLAEARRSVQALRPGPLDEAAHLPDALDDLARRWSQTSGVEVRVEITGSAVPLPPAVEVVLFRTAQEGLANIAKHAAASRAGLTLSYTHEVVMLDVLDDGAGFDTAPGGDSYGLTAMRQRLRQVGGTLEIESSPGDGTALSASVPATTAETAATGTATAGTTAAGAATAVAATAGAATPPPGARPAETATPALGPLPAAGENAV